eukprot:CAMPEP_0175558014 /NCGR_PEP_ID=MMETSP0096-20121207/35669_1 /TAXON_ID=311494 /ORGANISM="Alexandrium monilatum, Strain CCMP3105" /LENGTH=255 /DNA_ID=CAMNT_0016861175 /DNA_START=18 /DNA_END=782 /DNA_ORIENTATION=-
MARGISLPRSAAAQAGREGESPVARQQPEGTPTTGLAGCQSPTDSFFDPRLCQSPMDRFFEGPQVPSFFGPGQSGAGPSGCVVVQGVPSQGMAASAGAAPMVPFGPVGFGSGAPGVAPQVYLCPAGAVGPTAVQMAAIPAPVPVAQSSAMTMPVQLSADVPAGAPVALPAGAAAGHASGMAPEVGAPGTLRAAPLPAAAAARTPAPRREHPPEPPVTASPSPAESAGPAGKNSSEDRPPCPTAIYVDLTCLRERA